MSPQENDDWFSAETATLGDRLAAAREQAGLNQKQLAKGLGIKAGTLRDWEDDLAEPRANKLAMIAGVLGVSVGWLLSGEGEGVDAPLDEGAVSPDMTGVLNEMRELRVQISGTAERLARLEKRLREIMKDQNA